MCCFLGYNPGQKAYKLYDLTDKKIIMSRDVIFYESIFPFAKNNSVENINVLPNEANEEATEIPFEINHQDFIPTDAYNPDHVDLPNQFFHDKNVPDIQEDHLVPDFHEEEMQHEQE